MSDEASAVTGDSSGPTISDIVRVLARVERKLEKQDQINAEILKRLDDLETAKGKGHETPLSAIQMQAFFEHAIKKQEDQMEQINERLQKLESAVAVATADDEKASLEYIQRQLQGVSDSDNDIFVAPDENFDDKLDSNNTTFLKNTAKKQKDQRKLEYHSFSGSFVWKDRNSTVFSVDGNSGRSCRLDCLRMTVGRMYKWKVKMENVLVLRMPVPGLYQVAIN